tara:strand:- start:86 stop:310 length:225 start_codon:yes stop_codon:yes gene_type:complete
MSQHYVSHRFPRWERKMAKRDTDLYTEELIAAAESVVIGYEKYLMNKIDYKDLARIMTQLRELLPFESYDREGD